MTVGMQALTIALALRHTENLKGLPRFLESCRVPGATTGEGIVTRCVSLLQILHTNA